MNPTAATSCTMSTPTAIRPYRLRESERSSSTLTTKTVEEKDSAKPISASAPTDSWATSEAPKTASRPRNPTPIATPKTRWTVVVSQTSRRSRKRGSSLRPIVKSSSTTPRSAIVDR